MTWLIEGPRTQKRLSSCRVNCTPRSCNWRKPSIAELVLLMILREDHKRISGTAKQKSISKTPSARKTVWLRTWKLDSKAKLKIEVLTGKLPRSSRPSLTVLELRSRGWTLRFQTTQLTSVGSCSWKREGTSKKNWSRIWLLVLMP